MIGVLDLGWGNLASLGHGLDTLGNPWRPVTDPSGLAGCDRLVLPGVGAFGSAMAALRASGLDGALRAWPGPLLGICLGMQLMLEGSQEAPGVSGLGLLPGRCEAFDAHRLRTLHMGWSALAFQGETRPVYFVHGYRLRTWAGPEADLGVADHGGPFVAAFRCGRLGGFQFHPEKSGAAGLRLLAEALTWS